MSFLKGLRKFFAEPKTKTITPYAKGYGEKDIFGESKRDYETLKKYERIYMRGGLLTEGIKCYALSVFTPGFRIEGADPAMVAKCEDFVEQTKLDIVGPQAITDALRAGDSFQELARGRGLKHNEIVALIPRPPETFEIITDEGGLVKGYRQRKRDTPLSTEYINLEKGEVFHFNIDTIGGSPYGISIIQTAIDDIERDCWVAEAITEGIKRHGSPKFHVRVGQEGEDIPPDIMTRLDSMLQNVHSKNEFITPRDVEINTLDVSGMPNAEQYSQFGVQRLCAAIGVPEEFLGLGRGSTEATANVRFKIFYDKIRAIQRRFEIDYSSQVLDEVTQRPGSAYLVFNEPSTINMSLMADVILKLYQANPIDPIISKEEARSMLGFDVVEETGDEPSTGEDYWDEETDENA